MLNLLGVTCRLLCGYGIDVSAARVGCHLQHLVGDQQLGLLEVAPFDMRSHRQSQQAQERQRERAFDRQVIAAARALKAEARIRQAAGLHECGFGQAKLRVRSLQPAVVQQCDLHGVVHRQRLGKQIARASGGAVAGFG